MRSGVAKADLNVKGMVKNRRLVGAIRESPLQSISDVAWSIFRAWLEYYGAKYGKTTVAVPPNYTSQNSSNCGKVVKKSLFC